MASLMYSTLRSTVSSVVILPQAQAAALRAASSLADSRARPNHPYRDNRALSPLESESAAIEKTRKWAKGLTEPDIAPPTLAAPKRRLEVQAAGSVHPIDAGIARELRHCISADAVLKHYRENVEDYNIINMTAALSLVVKLSGKKRWKQKAVNNQHVSMLTHHIASELRAAMRLDRDHQAWAKASRASGAAAPQKGSTGDLPMRIITSALYSMSKIGVCPNSLLQEVSHTIMERVDEMSPPDVSQLAFAFSSQNAPAPMLFNRISEHVLSDMDQYSEIELSSLLSSYSSLRTASPKLFTAIAERLASRREQRGTVTPRILATAVMGLVRSLSHDKLLPRRFLARDSGESMGSQAQAKDDAKSHRAAAISSLNILAPRIEATARKYRVPQVEGESTAFTTQGLATIAWAYAKVYVDAPNPVKGGFTKAIALRLCKVAASGGSVGRAAATDFLNFVHDNGLRVEFEMDAASAPIANQQTAVLRDATVIRVLSSLSAAFCHPQTLATAPGLHLAMMASAVTTVRATLLSRWTGMNQLAHALKALPVTSGQVEALEVSEAYAAGLLNLLVQLNTRSTMERIASAVVRVLDPAAASVGEQAADGRDLLSGEVAVRNALESDKAQAKEDVMYAVTSSSRSNPRALQRVEAMYADDEGDEELSAALDLMRKTEEASGRVLSRLDLGANAPLAAAAALKAERDVEADMDEEEVGEAVRSRKYNPLSHAQNMALAIPVAMHDVAELSAAFSEVSPLLHVPELWAKLADRVERGMVFEERQDDVRAHTHGNRDASTATNLTREDGIRNMPARDVSRLATGFAIAAPDVYAARVLKAIAVVFASEDRHGSARDEVMPAIAPKQLSGPVTDGFDTMLSASSRKSREMDGNVDSTPSFDEAPTWSDDVRESLRRARTFYKAPTLPVHRLRGTRLDGPVVQQYTPGAGKDGSVVGSEGEGDPDVAELDAAEAPSVHEGTKGESWSARIMVKSSASTLGQLLSAFAMTLPMRGNSGTQGTRMQPSVRGDGVEALLIKGVKQVYDEAMPMTSGTPQAWSALSGVPASVSGGEKGTHAHMRSLEAALGMHRQAAGFSAATFSLPNSWRRGGGPADIDNVIAAHDACAPDVHPMAKDTLLYSQHPIISRKRWASGVQPFFADSSARGDVSKACIGSSVRVLQSISDESALACIDHFMRSLCNRLGYRVEGNEMSFDEFSDLMVLLVSRDYRALTNAALSTRARREKRDVASMPSSTSVYSTLVRNQALWLQKHVMMLQEKNEQEPRKWKKNDPARRKSSATAPWLDAEVRTKSYGFKPQEFKLPTPIRHGTSLYSYGGYTLAIGLEVWDLLAAEGWELSPGTMLRQAPLHTALLLMLDEASRRFAAEYEQRSKVEAKVQTARVMSGVVMRVNRGHAAVSPPAPRADGEVVHDLHRSDLAVSSFGVMVAAAVTPYAVATVPRLRVPADGEAAHRLQQIASAFVSGVAAGPALDFDPRLLINTGFHTRLSKPELYGLAPEFAIAERKKVSLTAAVGPDDTTEHLSSKGLLRGAAASVVLTARAFLEQKSAGAIHLGQQQQRAKKVMQ